MALRFHRMMNIRVFQISITIGIILWSSYAFSLIDIREAHRQAIAIFKETKDVGKAIEVLEQVGVRKIVNTKPKGLTERVYVSILNDYGFFLSETADRWTEAIPILEKVLTIDPNRSVAHLNLADTYRKALQAAQEQEQDVKLRRLMVEEYAQYARLHLQRTPLGALPPHVLDILDDEREEWYDDLTGRVTIAHDWSPRNVRVARLRDGRVAVGWAWMNPARHRFESRVIMYSLSLRALGSPVTVCNECILLELIAVNDGFWIITRDQLPRGTNELSARHYSWGLKEIRLVKLGEPDKIFPYPDYAFGALRLNARSSQIVLQLYPMDQEQAISTRVLAVAENTTAYSNPAALDGGKMLLAWVREEGGRKQIHGACLEAGSQQIEGEFLIGELGDRESSPTLISDGRAHLVTWIDLDDKKYDPSAALLGRFYDSTCRPSGLAVHLIETRLCCSHRYEVVGLGSGRFLAVFEDLSSLDNSLDVNAAVLSESGDAARFHVAGGKGLQYRPTGAVLPSGGFVAFWLDNNRGEVIHARLFGGL